MVYLVYNDNKMNNNQQFIVYTILGDRLENELNSFLLDGSRTLQVNGNTIFITARELIERERNKEDNPIR